MSEAKADTVAGLGFKDKEKAMETLKILEGRDPEYQKLAVKGLLGRAKRVLTLTKDKEKLNNIVTAMKIFDDFLKEYEEQNKGKENCSYLPLNTVTLFDKLDKSKSSNALATKFLKAYEGVKGEYKNLRTVESPESGKTWDIVRNENLKVLTKKYREDDESKLWESNGLPTDEHLKMIAWAYSPEAAKIKKEFESLREKVECKTEGKKRTKKSSSEEESSSSSEGGSPKKKSKS